MKSYKEQLEESLCINEEDKSKKNGNQSAEKKSIFSSWKEKLFGSKNKSVQGFLASLVSIFPTEPESRVAQARKKMLEDNAKELEKLKADKKKSIEDKRIACMKAKNSARQGVLITKLQRDIAKQNYEVKALERKEAEIHKQVKQGGFTEDDYRLAMTELEQLKQSCSADEVSAMEDFADTYNMILFNDKGERRSDDEIKSILKDPERWKNEHKDDPMAQALVNNVDKIEAFKKGCIQGEDADQWQKELANNEEFAKAFKNRVGHTIEACTARDFGEQAEADAKAAVDGAKQTKSDIENYVKSKKEYHDKLARNAAIYKFMGEDMPDYLDGVTPKEINTSVSTLIDVGDAEATEKNLKVFCKNLGIDPTEENISKIRNSSDSDINDVLKDMIKLPEEPPKPQPMKDEDQQRAIDDCFHKGELDQDALNEHMEVVNSAVNDAEETYNNVKKQRKEVEAAVEAAKQHATDTAMRYDKAAASSELGLDKEIEDATKNLITGETVKGGEPGYYDAGGEFHKRPTDSKNRSEYMVAMKAALAVQDIEKKEQKRDELAKFTTKRENGKIVYYNGDVPCSEQEYKDAQIQLASLKNELAGIQDAQDNADKLLSDLEKAEESKDPEKIKKAKQALADTFGQEWEKSIGDSEDESNGEDENDDDRDAVDGEMDAEEDERGNKKIKNPAKIWRRRKNKVTKQLSKNYYRKNKNGELESITPQEYKEKLQRFKQKQNESVKTTSFKNFLIESLKNSQS